MQGSVPENPAKNHSQACLSADLKKPQNNKGDYYSWDNEAYCLGEK